MAWSPDGQALFVGTMVGLERVAVATGQSLWWQPAWGRLNALALSPNGRWLAMAMGGALQAVALSEGGEWLAVTGWMADGWTGTWITIYAVKEGRRMASWAAAPGASIVALAFGPAGRWLASGASDGGMRVWRVPDGQELLQLEGHTGAVWAIQRSPDGRMRISGSLDGTVRIWTLL